jgi:hypothetical protein
VAQYVFTDSRFPDGTTLYATPLGFSDEPIVVPVASGSATFSGLRELTRYVVRGRVSGRTVESRFTSPSDAAGGSSSVAAATDVDAATAQVDQNFLYYDATTSKFKGRPGGDPPGYWSLEGHFGLTNVGTGASAGALTTQTTAIQNAINACIAAGKGLDVGSTTWAINAALAINGAITIRGQGASEVWGSGVFAQYPTQSPFVQGGGFVQTLAGANVLSIALAAANAISINLRDVLLKFHSTIAFQNTGHGVAFSGAAPPVFCDWWNVIVFGHDGNHYAFDVNGVAGGYSQFRTLRTYGGGGWHDRGTQVNGNYVLENTFFEVLVAGTAHGIWMEDAGASSNGLNLVTMIRPQSYFFAVAGGSALGTAYPFLVSNPPVLGAGSTQYAYRDSGTFGPLNMTLVAPDFEPATQPINLSSGISSAAGTVVVGAALLGNTTNTVQGINATNPLAGGDNTAIGRRAGATVSTGSRNTVVGSLALLAETTGSDNTAIGYNAMAGQAGVSASTAVGSSALKSSTTGTNNTAVGSSALKNSTTAGSCTAVGASALLTNTTGAQNVAVGSSALLAVSTGSRNTSVGHSSLANATTNDNTALGYNALTAQTSGATNTAVGSGAVAALSTGSGATGVGKSALAAVTTGASNTAIGLSAGQSNVTTGANNTFLGAFSGASANVSHGLAIGYSTSVAANGTVAIGTDSAGTGASAATANYFVLGTANHKLFMPGLPTANPAVVGQLWNNAGVVTVSAG